MSNLYDQIVSNRGSLERLVARIPGFRGYQDKQARRTADRMLRDYIVGQLDERLRRLVRIEKLILDNLGMSFMPRTRDAKGKLQLYRDKIATAAPKYDGMWAQMKIEGEQLAEIYSFDEAQILYVEKIDLALEQLQEAVLEKEGVEAAIFELDGLVNEAIDAFALRDDVLTRFADQV
ncbi:MAG: hypothetical protein EA396_13640 [Anaerolineaceae bacterium]|nr:MAG: hypothetical protein EA396_13640 [Anaerolineaceae bacterium]